MGRDGGGQLFIAHRFEGRLFKDKLGLALNEAIIYQNKDGYVALEMLMPLTLLHNINRVENSNSLLTLEADFALTVPTCICATIMPAQHKEAQPAVTVSSN
ncbi:MAG: hypothetical protein LBO67_00165 [Spirochaetaceae bacterium]|nr:hypothetical protein [Spirochaetaceae bacterium]